MLLLVSGVGNVDAVKKLTISGKEAFERLSKAYGSDLVADLARVSGFSRQTIQNWIDRPDSELYETTERKLALSISKAIRASSFDPSELLAAIQAVNANVELLRRELLLIRGQDEDRARQVVGGKKKHGGAA